MVFQAFKALTIFVWKSNVFPSSLEEGILNTSFCLLALFGSIPPTGYHGTAVVPSSEGFVIFTAGQLTQLRFKL